MPQGCGPAVGIPAATNDEFATWKTSTRDSAVFVRYSSPVPPLAFLLKIASAIVPPAGSPLVIPATMVTVSNLAAPAGLGTVNDAPATPRLGVGLAPSMANACITTRVPSGGNVV